MKNALSKTGIALFIVLGVGIALRFYRIATNDLLFYDEGMYLGYNRGFLGLVAANPPHSIGEFFIILGLMAKTALTTAKALWFFILNLRVFFTGVEGWYFARIVSALAGLGTIAVTYLWARKYFDSKPAAVLSAVILSVLPSHVFYSRLGMQESLSAFLFLTAMYLYVFSRRGVSLSSLWAGVFLSAVFFTNYRMIIGPIFFVLAQVWIDRAELKKMDLKKLAWSVLVFAVLVFGIGSLYGGVNTKVTFGWMLHQADEAGAHRHWTSFLSFPYYLFTLENIFFGGLFFASIYAFFKRWSAGLLPFLVVSLQMLLFSFAAEKGARYLCVVLPFAAMAVAHMILVLKEQYPKYTKVMGGIVVVMLAGLIWGSFLLARAGTDYQKAIAMVLAHDPDPKIMSTQPLVESLFLRPENMAVDLPKDPVQFAALLKQGYRYVIVDPQAYISWTADGLRFTTPLNGLIEAIGQKVSPVAVLPHIEGELLKRFVLDHNQDLFTSLEFLRNAKGRGQIVIYDLGAGK